MTHILESAVVAGVALAALVIFAPALVVQFRGDTWLPKWVPPTVRRRHHSPAVRLLAIAWSGAWTFGGQALVVALALEGFSRGDQVAGLILLAEAATAVAFAIGIVRASAWRSA